MIKLSSLVSFTKNRFCTNNSWRVPSRFLYSSGFLGTACSCGLSHIRFKCNTSSKIPEILPPWRVLYFGTDDFSLQSLNLLSKELSNGEYVSHLDIVTSLKAKVNPVKKFAEEHNLNIHGWPCTVKPGEYDIGLVVSFGHLIPEDIITAFPLGMLNVHASLLPRWRGAAPIIHCIRNGDTETGVTIMQILPGKFDIGGIVRQAKYQLFPDDELPSVTKAMAMLGAQLLVECVRELPHCLNDLHPQPSQGVTYAPRVTAADAAVCWNKVSAIEVYNLHRSMVGVFPLCAKWFQLAVKLYKASLKSHSKTIETKFASCRPGYVVYDRHKKLLVVKCSDGQWIGFGAIGIPGKKCSSFCIPMLKNSATNPLRKVTPLLGLCRSGSIGHSNVPLTWGKSDDHWVQGRDFKVVGHDSPQFLSLTGNVRS